MLSHISRFTVIAFVSLLALAGCTGDTTGAPPSSDVGPSGATSSSDSPEPTIAQASLRSPADAVAVLPAADAAELALTASAAFFDSAPIAVVVSDDDAEVLRAASAAVALGAPLLLANASNSAQVQDELSRLGATTALTFGDVETIGSAAAVDDEAVTWIPAPTDDAELADLLGAGEPGDPIANGNKPTSVVLKMTRGTFSPVDFDTPKETPADNELPADATPPAEPSPSSTPTDSPQQLPSTQLPDPSGTVLALTTKSAVNTAAMATATAAGAQVVVVAGGDPRKTSKSVQAIAEADYTHVIGIGAAFADVKTLTWQLATAATGVELPGGGQLVFPGKRYVALYGTPSSSALGVLGEQDVPSTVKRAAKTAKKYQKHTADAVVPALEIIATVASSGAGKDGNYSNELPPKSLRPLIDAAHEAGQYVVLDLQPGRSSFLEQAKLYEDLLALPYVGLALDPEWNLGPDEVHMRKIGSATAKEVNEVVTWLADFTQERALPQKMLVLHQFQVRMISPVDDVDLSRSELAVLIHVDGQGSQPAKQDTWKTLIHNAPQVQWWGWKNFYDEDQPMLTTKQTTKVKPFPHFVSYQ